MIRGFLTGFMIAAGLVGPWWLPIVPAVLLSLRWTAYEVIVLGSFMDLVLMPMSGLWGIPLVNTVAAAMIVAVFAPIRRQLTATHSSAYF
jgi:hypothetical protein